MSDQVTSAMMNAGADAMREGMAMLNCGRSYQSVCVKIYEAMQEASPPLPQQGGEQTDWKHAANEWADTACNALDGLKNIRDNGANVNAVIANLQECIQHARDVGAAVAPQVGEAKPGIRWDLFPGWLIDHAEGEPLMEETLQAQLADMIAFHKENPPTGAAA